jgi:tRNA(Ile)-lysidine synthase TilS/MesJ
MMSPYTSYKDVFRENNLDFSDYEIPDIDTEQYSNNETARDISLIEGDRLYEKLDFIVSNSLKFHESREELWNVSRRYNPMNMKFLYEGMFEYLRGML